MDFAGPRVWFPSSWVGGSCNRGRTCLYFVQTKKQVGPGPGDNGGQLTLSLAVMNTWKQQHVMEMNKLIQLNCQRWGLFEADEVITVLPFYGVQCLLHCEDNILSLRVS